MRTIYVDENPLFFWYVSNHVLESAAPANIINNSESQNNFDVRKYRTKISNKKPIRCQVPFPSGKPSEIGGNRNIYFDKILKYTAIIPFFVKLGEYQTCHPYFYT